MCNDRIGQILGNYGLFRHYLRQPLMDADCLGFPDNNFDYVVTTFTLYSIPNPLKALKEMRRFLKQSGELIAIEYVQSSNHFIA